jgi:hypothetical protein
MLVVLLSLARPAQSRTHAHTNTHGRLSIHSIDMSRVIHSAGCLTLRRDDSIRGKQKFSWLGHRLISRIVVLINVDHALSTCTSRTHRPTSRLSVNDEHKSRFGTDSSAPRRSIAELVRLVRNVRIRSPLADTCCRTEAPLVSIDRHWPRSSA